MNLAVKGLIALVAAEHLLFLVLEMFLWQRPLGRKIFRLSAADAKVSAPLAANQGLYNGFLAAGLVWSVARNDASLATFFLGCVTVAGIFGAVTVRPRLFLVQGLPAVVALVALCFLD